MSSRAILVIVFLITFWLVMLLSKQGWSSLFANKLLPSFMSGKSSHLFLFKESKLAHQLLDGLKGIEIGAAAHNPFGLTTLNVDFTTKKTVWKTEDKEMSGKNARIDVIAFGDALPFPDESYDFVISSHVIEHFYDPIKAIKEWFRVIKKDGYIYMIIPHKDRTYDKNKTRTTLEELLDRHENPSPPKNDDHLHHSFWITEDFLELCRHLKWKIAAMQDVDEHNISIIRHCEANLLECRVIEGRPYQLLANFTDHQNGLGTIDRQLNPLNIDCGLYVQHCLKVVKISGEIYKGCDSITLCPKDGTKLVYNADYFCCQGDLCNSSSVKNLANIFGTITFASITILRAYSSILFDFVHIN